MEIDSISPELQAVPSQLVLDDSQCLRSHAVQLGQLCARYIGELTQRRIAGVVQRAGRRRTDLGEGVQ
jgi:hypothetical protein